MASRQPGVPATRLTIDRGPADAGHWPYTVPAVRHIWDGGLDLRPGATVFIGQNGSGKSTLVEAIAAVCTTTATGWSDPGVHSCPSPTSSCGT